MFSLSIFLHRPELAAKSALSGTRSCWELEAARAHNLKHDGQRRHSNGARLPRYGLIQDKDWTEAIALLSELLEDSGPSSRALMSLLGFCQYSAEEYDDAASTYQKLCKLCPESSEYQVYLAQALAKAGAMEEANQVVVALEEDEDGSVLREDLMRLKLVIKADSGDLAMAREMIDGVQEDPENLVCASSIAFHQGLYEEALSGYSRALDTFGFRPDLAYNMAICSYKLKDYGRAMEVVTDAIGHIYEAPQNFCPTTTTSRPMATPSPILPTWPSFSSHA